MDSNFQTPSRGCARTLAATKSLLAQKLFGKSQKAQNSRIEQHSLLAFCWSTHHDVEVDGLSSSLHESDRLRVAVVGDEELGSLPSLKTVTPATNSTSWKWLRALRREISMLS